MLRCNNESVYLIQGMTLSGARRTALIPIVETGESEGRIVSGRMSRRHLTAAARIRVPELGIAALDRMFVVSVPTDAALACTWAAIGLFASAAAMASVPQVGVLPAGVVAGLG